MANYGGAAAGAAAGAKAGSMFGPWGTGIGGVAGGLFGLLSGGGHHDSAVVPKDIAALRKQNIELLQAFLKSGAFDTGGAGSNFFFGAGGNPLQNLLNSPSPEMSAYDTARPILEGMLTGTGPQFERDIASANAGGGRFSSGNAIMRGEALRNLFNQRTQTASTLGALAGQAGSSQFDRAMSVQAQRLQLLAGLLGMSGQASLSLPVQSGNDSNPDFMNLMKLFATMGGSYGGKTKGPGGD